MKEFYGSYEFEDKLKKFNSFYLWLVISVFALILAAIVTVIYLNLLIGIILGIAGAVIYVFLLSDEIVRTFGIKQRSITGGLAVSVVANRIKKGENAPEDKFIPARLLWLDVTEIVAADGNAQDKNTITLFIPASIKKIEAEAFSNMTALCRIVYNGSPEKWLEINDGRVIENITVVYMTEEEIDEFTY